MNIRKLFLLIILVFISTGCAVFNRDNTPVLNTFEKYAVPKNKALRTITYPVLIPTGLVAVTTDACVLHPAMVVDNAVDDAEEILWDDFDWDKEYVTECASLIPRTVLSPIVFTGTFLGRSMFDIPDRKLKSKTRKNNTHRKRIKQKQYILQDQAKQNLQQAQMFFQQKQYNQALSAINLALKKYKDIPNGFETKALILIETEKYLPLYFILYTRPKILLDGEVSQSILNGLIHKKKADQIGMLYILEACFKKIGSRSGYDKIKSYYLKKGIEPLMDSDDRVIIYQAMRVAGEINTAESKAALTKIQAKGDPVLSTAAYNLLRKR